MKADVAAAFDIERASILMFYAARIEAVRRGATPSMIIAAIRAIVNEKIVALRNLATRRRQAASTDAAPARPETSASRQPFRRAPR